MKENSSPLLFESGEHFYQALLSRLSQASEVISMSYLAFVSGRWGNSLAEVMMDKAKSGVKVELTIDYFGNFFEQIPQFFANQKLYRQMREAGIVVNCLPLSLSRGPMHDKFCMIDHQYVAFGGSNVADHYTEWADTNFILDDLNIDPNLWPSMYENLIADHCRTDLTSSFSLDANHELYLHMPPDNKHFQIQLLDLFHHSQRSLNLVTWYFAPNKEVMSALHDTLQRGVQVELMVSLRSRLWFYNLLNLPLLEQLKKHENFHLRYWTKGYNHSKLYWNEQAAILGSANLDFASLERSRELLVVSRDSHLIEQLNQRFTKFQTLNTDSSTS